MPGGAPAPPALGAGFPGMPGGLPGMLQFPIPMLTDMNMLSQMTGVPLKSIRENQSMAMAAQQLFAQRMLQQQLINSGQLARPGVLQPNLQQLQAMQLQQMQVAAMSSAGKPAKPRGKAAAPKPARPVPPRDPSLREDPGGKVIWAKVANYPWWPAKVLDPTRDLSFPPDADPPRPTAIPIRFFGTHEFAWMGSKRAIEDWEDGEAQHRGESAHESFTVAVAEAEAYRAGARLPEVFYLVPEPEGGRRGKGRKRPAGASPAGGAGSARKAEGGDGLGTPTAGGARARPARTPLAAAEDRARAVHARKQQRLLDLGLMPPADSPFLQGRVAPTPALLGMRAGWMKAGEAAAVMADAAAAAAQPLPLPRATLPPPPKPAALLSPPVESPPMMMSLNAPPAALAPFALPPGPPALQPFLLPMLQ
jgi:hypothetical protein